MGLINVRRLLPGVRFVVTVIRLRAGGSVLIWVLVPIGYSH